MRNRLALFDSGIGGFSVLKSICSRHSNFSAIYLADTARLPYGSRCKSEIREIALEISEWLNCQKIDAVIVACNTTNSLALDVVQKTLDVPVFDLIGSAIDLIRTSRIGVLATPSTVSSTTYTSYIKTINPLAFVIEEGCSGLVPLIEKRKLNSLQIKEIAANHLKNLLKEEVQEIVLGCSHFPLIKPIINELIPYNINLIDPATALSKRLDEFLGHSPSDLELIPSFPDIQFCVTSDPIRFTSATKQLLGINPKVELISLRSKSCVL